MSLWKIAWRSIQQRGLASGLTCLSMALGVTLVVAVLVVHSVVSDAFTRNPGMGYDMIVGAKGGDYQLVLNTVYHLSRPVQNIPYAFYKEFTDGRYKKYVSRVIPYCLGDNYQGFRVVGTIPAMFDPEFEYASAHRGRPSRRYEFQEGRNFIHENFFEGVIGAEVARRTGLKIGDEFKPSHGVTDEGADGHEHDAFKVVGILKTTGTPNDRALFINMEGFYLLDKHALDADEATPHKHDHGAHDHAHDGHDHSKHEHPPAAGAKTAPKPAPPATAPESKTDSDAPKSDEPGKAAAPKEGHSHAHGPRTPLPENQREVTALLVRTTPNDPLAGMILSRAINKGLDAQAVSPVKVVTGLFDTFVSRVQYVLLGLTILVVIVAGIGILVSIYNSMNDRRREIAIMRALGARRSTVLSVILLESILLSLGGGLLGWLLGHGVTWLANPWLMREAGVSVGLFQLVTVAVGPAGNPVAIPVELLLVGGLIGLASLVGYLPALSAYRTDVSRCLSASP